MGDGGGVGTYEIQGRNPRRVGEMSGGGPDTKSGR